MGEGQWIVVEADESDGTFLKLRSTVAVVTNIDPEHLDHYGDFDAVKRAFRDFVQDMPFYGFAAVCIDDPDVQEMAALVENRRLITYGTNPQAEIRAAHIDTHGRRGLLPSTWSSPIRTARLPCWARCTCRWPAGTMCSTLLAAIAIGRELGVALEKAIRTGLAGFGGVRRRFTTTGVAGGVRVIDDYGHHPVEIAAVLRAARAVTNGKVIAVVQPHRYSRLHDLFDEFCRCFNDADAVIVADVYPAGEAPIDGANRDALVDGLKRFGHRRAIPLPNAAALPALIAEEAKDGDLVVCLGAGDITTWAYALPGQLEAMAK